VRAPWDHETEVEVRHGRSWTNWAGTASFEPVAVEAPRSVAELARIVRAGHRRGQRVRVAGAGHSFTPLCLTDGVQVHLDRLRRVLDIDREAGTVTVEAGIRLHRLNTVLAARGLALANLGDIAEQSVAGAVSTGTHGTGARFGGLATFVQGLDILLADGSVVHCGPEEEPELYAAARIGLGALGVITAVTLSCVPAFNLRAVEGRADLEPTLDSFDELVAAHDHYECYWVPHTGRVRTKANDRTTDPPAGRGRLGHLYHREFLDNVLYGSFCRLARALPVVTPTVARMVAAGGRSEWIERSDRIFTSPRRVRFVEMEYALPRAALGRVVRDLREVSERFRVVFPVEMRVAAADDVWLSTAHGRDTAYVAVHQYRGMPYQDWFAAAEAVFWAAGGRPHWGKLHTRGAADLAPRYPRWDDFQAVRRRVDPEGMWGNAHLDRVLGPVG
jgi:FAD-linked oxidoreductase